MKEPVIWEIAAPEVTLDDLFQAQGSDYSNKSPRPMILELNRRMLEEAATLVRSIAIWREVEVAGSRGQELLLEEGQKLTSKLLVRVAGTADKLIFFTMTIGSPLDERVAAYNKEGKIAEAFTLDAAGSAFIAKSSSVAMGKVEEQYKSAGMQTTFPLGPGHSYWSSLEDMQTIFHFLNPGEIGIHLTDSNLMLPRKSIAMVIGVGRNLPDLKGRTHCDFCSLQKTCNMSKFGCAE